MQLLIVCILPLPGDISRDNALTAVLSHRVHEVSFPPELPSPKLILNLRSLFKHFARDDTFDRSDNSRRTVG